MMSITDTTRTSVADANGDADVSIMPYRRQVWKVQQVSTEAPAALGTALSAVYKGDFLISPLLAKADVASGDPPVQLRPSESLTVRWSGLVPGDRVRAIFIYDDGTV
jgi:hypothetical protein